MGTVTSSGSTISFFTPKEALIHNLIINFSSFQNGTGKPSPNNIRPINGLTNVELQRSYNAISNNEIISVNWFEIAGTQYGGYINLIDGKLTQTMLKVDLSNLTYIIDTDNNRFKATLPIKAKNSIVRTTYGASDILECKYNQETFDSNWENVIYIASDEVYIHMPQYNTIEELKSALSEHYLIYELKTPIIYQLTPHNLIAKSGHNIFTSNGDNINIEYDFYESAEILEIRKKIMLDPLPPLPPEYQKVQYVIGTSSASNFNTEVPGNNDNLRIQLSIKTDNHINYNGFFGNYASETANSWRMISKGSGNEKGLFFNINTRTGSSRGLDTKDASSIVGKRLYIDTSYNKSVLTLNNKKSSTLTVPAKGTENNNPIILGNAANNKGNTTSNIHIKWYYCKIYDNETLIRYYIPCYRKSDNKVGFYDIINNEFKYSTGALQFTLS